MVERSLSMREVRGSIPRISREYSHLVEVLMPEWLSGMTRNHVGFARAGSNPAEHVFFLPFSIFACVFIVQETVTP
jgi:hypothetical protein